jgi:hypothetical protein
MKRARLVVLGVIIGATLTGGVAFGVAQPSSTTYYACLLKGKLSHVGSTSPTCPSKASVITWNQTGPQGPQGPQGATGSQGPAGPSPLNDVTWTGTTGTNGQMFASTKFPTGDIVTSLLAVANGNLSSCGTYVIVVDVGGSSGYLAYWNGDGQVLSGTPPSADLGSSISSGGGGLALIAICQNGGSVVPPPSPVTVTITVQWNQTAPTTIS